jgi:hypothetical protein
MAGHQFSAPIARAAQLDQCVVVQSLRQWVMPFLPSQSPCCSHPLSVAPLFLSAEAFPGRQFLTHAACSSSTSGHLPPSASARPWSPGDRAPHMDVPPARDLSKPAPSPSVIPSARHGIMVAGKPLRVFTSTPGSSLLGARPPGMHNPSSLARLDSSREQPLSSPCPTSPVSSHLCARLQVQAPFP